MSILWCGGEDIDFPNSSSGITTLTTTTYFRSAYARCNIVASGSGNSYAHSNAFPGGAVTSLWFSFQLGFFPENSNGSQRTGALCAGVGNTAVSQKGIYIYTTGGGGLGICTWDGTTLTSLAAGANGTVPNSIQVARIDLQISSYGASSVLTLWMNGALSCTFSGNSAITGLTNFNCVNLWNTPSGNFGAVACGSEFMVADEDTRSFSLKTMAPAGAGVVTQWTGLFSAINPTAINDANAVFVNTTAQNSAFTTTGIPAGTFAVRLVKTTVRAAATVGSTATGVNAGFNISSTVYGQTTRSALGTAFTNFEDFATTNPATSASWTTTDLTSVQIDVTSS